MFFFSSMSCQNTRLDVPSSPGSSTSSSLRLSPGCVSKGSSCTLCLWRSLKANTPGKSTTTCLVTFFLPSWSASPPLLTTRAMGQRKRECRFYEQILEHIEQTRWIQPSNGRAFFVVAALEKKWACRFRQCIMCFTLNATPKNIELVFTRFGQLFNVLCHLKVADELNTVVSGGLSYIKAFLLKDPPVTCCL